MTGQDTIVYIAGSPWDGIIGTDRQLVQQLGAHYRVLWVDPSVSPMSFFRARRSGNTIARMGLTRVGPRIWRLRSLSPPGVSRPLMRSLAATWLRVQLRRTVKRLSLQTVATVLATPEGRFPHLPGQKVYYLTDDWSAGAALMGIAEGRARRLQHRNLRDADLVCAVSESLLGQYRDAVSARTSLMLLPNGCSPTHPAAAATRPKDVPDAPYALMVGQLNERIDPDLIMATADLNVPVVVVGPRTERDPETSARFDKLFQHPHVHWLGQRPQHELAPYLSAAAVGITPYADTKFNRASFPLKTLEYLAAGLPVVSTDLPAVHWLDTTWIDTASRPVDFAEKTRSKVMSSRSLEAQTSCRAFAAAHSWSARAEALLGELALSRGNSRHGAMSGSRPSG